MGSVGVQGFCPVRGSLSVLKPSRKWLQQENFNSHTHTSVLPSASVIPVPGKALGPTRGGCASARWREGVASCIGVPSSKQGPGNLPLPPHLSLPLCLSFSLSRSVSVSLPSPVSLSPLLLCLSLFLHPSCPCLSLSPHFLCLSLPSSMSVSISVSLSTPLLSLSRPSSLNVSVSVSLRSHCDLSFRWGGGGSSLCHAVTCCAGKHRPHTPRRLAPLSLKVTRRISIRLILRVRMNSLHCPSF